MPPDDGQREELLTVEDVCDWFKVKKNWVYDEVEAGRLPHLRLGRRHLRFRPTDLQAYIDQTAAGGQRPDDGSDRPHKPKP